MIAVIHASDSGGPESHAPSEPPPRPVRCAPLPGPPSAVTPSVDGFAARMDAGRAIAASAEFEIRHGDEVSSQEEHLDWTRRCVKAWFAWRLTHVRAASQHFGEAFRRAGSPRERALALAAAAEAWIRMVEAFLRVGREAEPPRWRSDRDLHATYAEGLRTVLGPLLDREVRPLLDRCARAPDFSDAEKKGCSELGSRAEATTEVR